MYKTIYVPVDNSDHSNLAIQSVGAVTLNSANDVNNLAVTITGASNALQFTDTNALTISSTAIDGVTGVTTNAAGITLTAGGLLTVTQDISNTNQLISLSGVGITLGDGAGNGDLDAGSGTITLDANAGTLTVSAMAEVLSTGIINATADQYIIDTTNGQIGGATGFTSTAATVTLAADSLNTSMGIAGGGGTIQLSSAELARVLGTNVRLGDTANTGAVTVNTWTPVSTFATGVLTLASNGNATGITQGAGGIN